MAVKTYFCRNIHKAGNLLPRFMKGNAQNQIYKWQVTELLQ